MKDKVYPVLDDFSLINNGIFYRLLSNLQLGGTSSKHLAKRIFILFLITWVPMLILTAFQGLTFGSKVQITFLKDFTTHARFLIILPLLILAEGSFDIKLKELTIQFFKSGILDDKDIAAFDAIKKKIKELSDSIWPDIVIILIIIVNLILRLVTAGANHMSIWIFLPDTASSISLAGIYLALICGPLFQFIMFRWLWRWIIWFIYFRRLARLPLKLNSAHPDLAGGLGFLGYPPGPFVVVVFALAILFSTAVAQFIFFEHEKLQLYYPMMAAFAILTILMNVMPLLVFVRPMLYQRRKGIFEYSALIQEHHRQFDEKWLRKPHESPLPGVSDASSMTDFNTSFDVVKKMKPFPFDIKIMVSSIVVVILPILPLLAFEYNIADLVIKVLKMLA